MSEALAPGSRILRWLFVAGITVLAVGCGRETRRCVRCETLVVAATGEPETLNPALAANSSERDVGDLIFERLADLTAGASPLDERAYLPRLAARWQRVDSVTWRFTLRPGAAWHDGQPVSARDVVFSFDAFRDSTLDSPARSNLDAVNGVRAEGDTAVVITFSRPYGEQLYDATYYVRVLPEHVWSAIPRAEWAADTALAHLVGSGPYALESWQRGTGLALVARPRAPANIPRILWRFAADQDAALNLVLSHEADLIETVVNPNQLARATGDSALRVERYPSAVYGFLGFRLDDRPGQPAAAGLRSEKVRQALALAIDRAAVVRNVFGAEAKTPPGPMSAMLWIWDEKIPHTGFDPAEANRLLDGEGWVRAGDGVRHKGGRALALDLLVPATSSARRQLAIAIQEMWRRVGVTASVSAVDFPVFQERLHTGRFDGYIGAWLDDPSPRGLADQWTRAGWPALNYGHYASARFDSLLTRASSLANPEAARAAWHEAIEVLNGDVPAVFLYTPVNAALVNRRVEGVTIDAYSWLHTLPQWKLRSE